MTCSKLGEDDQRLEIVNCNDFTYLTPFSDKEATQISSYHRWEQAFRVLSNVITKKYPSKLTEGISFNQHHYPMFGKMSIPMTRNSGIISADTPLIPGVLSCSRHGRCF